MRGGTPGRVVYVGWGEVYEGESMGWWVEVHASW